MPAVRLSNLTKRFGRIVAVENLSLDVQDGEYVTFLGPSGCGKTTVIKMIAGIFQPDEGEIFFDGKRMNNVPIEDRGLGYVFQNILLFPNMDVWGNITYGPRVRDWDIERTKRLTKEILLMTRLNVRLQDYPNELSGGAQQKVAVSRALSSGANLLLLDEPLAALDAKVRAQLRHELRRLVKDLGLTAIHVTHDQEEAMAISDRIVVMRKGKLVEDSSPEELYRNPKNIFTANFIGEANFLVSELEESEGTVKIRFQNSHIRTARKLAGRTGDKVVVAIRPEHLNVAEERRSSGDQLQGVVANITFMGSFLRYEIQLEDGQVLKCDVLRTGDEKFLEIGANVFLSAEPENVLVYQYPPDGLENEITLE
jgi:iron(III) transport system ATP-binding protein